MGDGVGVSGTGDKGNFLVGCGWDWDEGIFSLVVVGAVGCSGVRAVEDGKGEGGEGYGKVGREMVEEGKMRKGGRKTVKVGIGLVTGKKQKWKRKEKKQKQKQIKVKMKKKAMIRMGKRGDKIGTRREEIQEREREQEREKKIE